MKREEAIKLIDTHTVCFYNEIDSPTLQALHLAIEALQDRPKGDWIPCSEGLPSVDVEVLTTTDWSDVLIAWLNKDGAWEIEELILANDEILAWMPLPKPYKGGDTE